MYNIISMDVFFLSPKMGITTFEMVLQGILKVKKGLFDRNIRPFQGTINSHLMILLFIENCLHKK